MQDKKPFKQPPKKFQPRGLTILYEDWDLLVVNKTSGMLSVSSESVVESSAQFLLNEYVRKGNSKSKNRVFVMHPLERDMSGVMVYAKSEAALHFLQDKWVDFKKKYTAVVCGKLPEEAGVQTSFLAENSIHKMYSVADSGAGVFARTGYRVLKGADEYSLVELDPMTGRKNQMRVHMADLNCPVAGDKKYGKKGGIKRLCLHSASLTLIHPFSKETMTFNARTPAYFNTLVK